MWLWWWLYCWGDSFSGSDGEDGCGGDGEMVVVVVVVIVDVVDDSGLRSGSRICVVEG